MMGLVHFHSKEHSNRTSMSYGDECAVIPNENDDVRLEELARAFLASPGVDPRLISATWIRNHFRWIVWKLAAMEKCFPNMFGGKWVVITFSGSWDVSRFVLSNFTCCFSTHRCLTLDNVLLQLKFRYDWEVDRCQRSALKRILECDDSPSKTLVLCIAAIKSVSIHLGNVVSAIKTRRRWSVAAVSDL